MRYSVVLALVLAASFLGHPASAEQVTVTIMDEVLPPDAIIVITGEASGTASTGNCETDEYGTGKVIGRDGRSTSIGGRPQLLHVFTVGGLAVGTRLSQFVLIDTCGGGAFNKYTATILGS